MGGTCTSVGGMLDVPARVLEECGRYLHECWRNVRRTCTSVGGMWEVPARVLEEC